MAQKETREVRTFSLDTSVLISHLKGDRFAEQTDLFLQRAVEGKKQLVITDVVYAELYTGIFLAPNSRAEETRVQSLLKVNGVEVRTSRSLRVARRAGELYSKAFKQMAKPDRILPDFLIAAQAEATSQVFVTWNEADYKDMGLRIPIAIPSVVSRNGPGLSP